METLLQEPRTLESSCSAHEKWPPLKRTSLVPQPRGKSEARRHTWGFRLVWSRTDREKGEGVVLPSRLAALFSKERHLPSEHEMFAMGIIRQVLAIRCLLPG